MRLQKMLDFKQEYEVQSVADYLNLIESLISTIDSRLNNGTVFEQIFEELEYLFSLKEINEKHIKSYLESYKDFLPFTTQIPSANDNYPRKANLVFYYRGVYNGPVFNLLPSALRGNRYGKESEYYRYVKSQCSGDYLGLSQLNTLVKMQHYDCPTRLLDISSNPLVGLYFACKNYGCPKCDKSNYGYVYIFINPDSKVLFDDSDKAIILTCLAKLDINLKMLFIMLALKS